jgi:hypothetical protein
MRSKYGRSARREYKYSDVVRQLVPRAYSTLPEPDDDSLPNHRIPDLTYDTAKDLIMEPDYIMVSFKKTKPRSTDFDVDHGIVKTNRSISLQQEFYARFEHLFAQEHSFRSVGGGLRSYHAKIIPKSHETFNEIETFLEDMVPLWSHASISYCWSNHAYPRVNTLVYELTDDKPPHPETYAFVDETSIRGNPNDYDDDELETYFEYEEAHRNYDETPDSPRFEYGPSLILNGDHGAGGADITAYGMDTLDMDFRFETNKEIRYDGEMFPATSRSPWYDRLTDFLPDYPESLDVTELTTDWNTVLERNTPQPLNPEPDEYTA